MERREKEFRLLHSIRSQQATKITVLLNAFYLLSLISTFRRILFKSWDRGAADCWPNSEQRPLDNELTRLDDAMCVCVYRNRSSHDLWQASRYNTSGWLRAQKIKRAEKKIIPRPKLWNKWITNGGNKDVGILFLFILYAPFRIWRRRRRWLLSFPTRWFVFIGSFVEASAYSFHKAPFWWIASRWATTTSPLQYHNNDGT